jgi:hypothetical protein
MEITNKMIGDTQIFDNVPYVQSKFYCRYPRKRKWGIKFVGAWGFTKQEALDKLGKYVEEFKSDVAECEEMASAQWIECSVNIYPDGREIVMVPFMFA